ncbi:MAG: hypothetical protein OES14_00435 [Nitrosopumilus sp.]|nr:hypothetical protein [Nitrosopumilus sp.]MDH3824245.1 hypothetical protein [Nitrosopumilus sp.]
MKLISWIIFLFSITIVLISFVSVIFPALILVSNTLIIPEIESITPNPYESGVWSAGVIISNVIIFGLTFLYLTNRLPIAMSNALKRLFAFEVSKKIAFISITILLIIYITASVSELSTEENFEDYKNVKNRVEGWSIDQAFGSFEPHVRYFLISTSMILFGNFKIIPFLASIALLITTYFITKTIAQKRFAGIVSMVIVLQSNLFLTYDTTVAYTNFWILFYLSSLFFIYKFWPLSPVFYLLSISAKTLTIAFLPMSIFFILRSKISKKQKMLAAGITTAIIIVGGIAMMGSDLSPTQEIEEEFNEKEFWMGFTSFSYQLRFDGLIILFMVPLIVGLFLISKRGIKNAESIMVLIAGMLLIAPVLTGFTDQTNQPYRFVPLVIFFAMGVGVLLSKRQA